MYLKTAIFDDYLVLDLDIFRPLLLGCFIFSLVIYLSYNEGQGEWPLQLLGVWSKQLYLSTLVINIEGMVLRKSYKYCVCVRMYSYIVYTAGVVRKKYRCIIYTIIVGVVRTGTPVVGVVRNVVGVVRSG